MKMAKLSSEIYKLPKQKCFQLEKTGNLWFRMKKKILFWEKVWSCLWDVLVLCISETLPFSLCPVMSHSFEPPSREWHRCSSSVLSWECLVRGQTAVGYTVWEQLHQLYENLSRHSGYCAVPSLVLIKQANKWTTTPQNKPSFSAEQRKTNTVADEYLWIQERRCKHPMSET